MRNNVRSAQEEDQIPSTKRSLSIDWSNKPLGDDGLLQGLESLSNQDRVRVWDLNLKRTNITVLPCLHLASLPKLTSLFVRGNPISVIPEELGLLTGLTRLSIDSLQISKLPQSIGLLTRLVDLWLPHNPLRSLPSTMDKLVSLTYLQLHSNLLPVRFQRTTFKHDSTQEFVREIGRYYRLRESAHAGAIILLGCHRFKRVGRRLLNKDEIGIIARMLTRESFIESVFVERGG